MNYAFPGFVELEGPTEDMRREMAEHVRLGANYVSWKSTPQRRYSGGSLLGEDLPRGRYYSLAYDNTGNDFGTLVRELLAYSDPRIGGLMSLLDLPYNAAANMPALPLGVSPELCGSILVIFVDSPLGRSPVFDLLIRDGVVENRSQDRALFATPLRYQLSTASIPGTLDLRTVNGQEWLVNEFAAKDSLNFNKADRSGADSFVKLLPTLLSPTLGGDHFTAAIGIWLRLHGVNALIYPSARSNCHVTNQQGQLMDYRGWCLVDYRGAPTPRFKDVFDYSPGWPQKLGNGVQVRVASGSKYRGSWQVLGLEEWYHEALTEKEREFVNPMQRKDTLAD